MLIQGRNSVVDKVTQTYTFFRGIRGFLTRVRDLDLHVGKQHQRARTRVKTGRPSRGREIETYKYGTCINISYNFNYATTRNTRVFFDNRGIVFTDCIIYKNKQAD